MNTPAAIDTPPTLSTLFLAFARIGVTSFGGGLSGWLMREFVHRRHWISEEDFLSGLALSQAFPGINVVNLSIWIGYRLRGRGGAVAAALGMVIPAMFVAIIMVMVFAQISQSKTAHLALAGIAAAAIGLSLEMGLRAARHTLHNPISFLIMAGIFVAIFVFELNLIGVILVAAPCSIAAAWLRLNKKDKKRETAE
ncbi:MAG TPA: chromate transporter [Candidimonas sp.]|nr:chromate transporter [Candidimonas sp.]